ncbi:MAG: hypothetical protein ACKOXB_08215 [Flavobacteriales bacterium]
MMRFFSFVVVAFFLFSCAEERKEKKTLLGDFWKSEIERLNKEKPMVTKISFVNGQSDTLHTNDIDWTKELNVFLMNDLDSNQLINYTGVVTSDVVCAKDTTSPCDLYICDIFSANNPEERIQKIKIWSLKDMPTSIEIIVQKNHELFTQYKELVYSKKGFEISGSQNIKFIDGIDYKVKVTFQ